MIAHRGARAGTLSRPSQGFLQTHMTVKLIDPTTLSIPAKEVTLNKAADSISFYNPANQEPYVAVVEVTRGAETTTDRTTYVARVSEIPSFPLLDPATGEPVGTEIDVATMYAQLYSMYVYMRNMPKPEV